MLSLPAVWNLICQLLRSYVGCKKFEKQFKNEIYELCAHKMQKAERAEPSG